MPIIRIDFDKKQVPTEEVERLSQAIRNIVSEVTTIEDVFVYANSPEIIVKAAPIEVFVEMSAHKIKDLDALTAEFVSRLKEWKVKNDFQTSVNFSVIPMPWKIEIGI